MAEIEEDPLFMHGVSRESIGKGKAAAAAAAAKAPAPKTTAAPSTLKKSLPMPTPPPPPPEMAMEEKTRFVDHITAYREKFPWLKKRNGNVTAKSGEAELRDEMHYIESQLGCKNQDSSFGLTCFTSAMTGLEMSTSVWNPLGLQLTGLGQIARDNSDQFKDVVDELLVKYTTGMYMSPETRLIMSVGALVMTVHAANTGDPRVKMALERMNVAVKVPPGAEDL
jgi:hypothetical protein